MKSILQPLLGVWGWFRQLPIATQVASGILAALVVTLGVLNFPTSNNSAQMTTTHSQTVAIPTQTVGAESEAFATFASWPGEIISYGEEKREAIRQYAIERVTRDFSIVKQIAAWVEFYDG